jgi:hypothetical protein
MRQERRYPRVPGPFDGSWNGSSNRRDVRIIDLSLGGCFIDDLTRPAPGEAIRVTLALPNASPIEVGGRVVYVDRIQGFGVAFTDVDPTTHVLQTALGQLGTAAP